jgi:sugar lactone lactonase YvrE
MTFCTYMLIQMTNLRLPPLAWIFSILFLHSTLWSQPAIVTTTSYSASSRCEGGLTHDDSGNLYYSSGVSHYRQSTDGSPPIALTLSPSPIAALTESEGGLFLFASQNQIHRMTAAGSTEVAAGTLNTSGYADAPSPQAVFGNNLSAAADAAGTIYVADKDNDVVRKITTNGYVETLAGVAGESATLDGTGNNARFSSPSKVIIDAQGNLIVLDGIRIRKVTPTGVVTTLAGNELASTVNGTGAGASFTSLKHIIQSPNGNFYVADGDSVRRVTQAGVVETIAGHPTDYDSRLGRVDGVGLEGRFYEIQGLALHLDGGIIVGDYGVFRHIAVDGSPFAPAIESSPQDLVGLIGEDYSLTVTAYGNPAPSYQWSRDGNLLIGQTGATLNLPDIAATDSGSYTVEITNEHGSAQSAAIAVLAREVAVNDDFAGRITLSGPSASASENYIRASRQTSEPIHSAGADGGSLWWTWTAPADGFFTFDASASTTPSAVRLYSGTNVSALTPVMADENFAAKNTDLRQSIAATSGTTYQIAVERMDAGTPGFAHLALRHTFIVETLAGTRGQSGIVNGAGAAANFSNPKGIVHDSTGGVFVADATTIRKVTPEGVVTTFVTGSFNNPAYLMIDTSDNLYLTDNHVVLKITAAGSISDLAGLAGTSGNQEGSGTSARFHFPSDLEIDASGNIYVADTFNHVIRKITPAGASTTLAGNAGTAGSSDGPGSNASFNYPDHLALVGNTLYVTDNSGLRVVDIPTATVTTLISDGVWQNASALAANVIGDVHAAFSGEIKSISPSGAVTTLLGSNPLIGGEYLEGDGLHAAFSYVNGLSVDATGTVWFNSQNTVHRAQPSTLAIAPLIHTQPQGGSIALGNDLELHVIAFGGPTLAYQWKKDGVPLAGENGLSLTIANTQISNSGSYTVTVSNPSGSLESSAATITIVPIPSNDDFSSATTLSGASTSSSGTNYGASLEVNEPTASDAGTGRTVWWTWTAPADGTVVADSGGSDIKVLLGVYTGSSLASLQLLASNDNSSSSESAKVYFPVSAGKIYSFALDGLDAEAVSDGALRLNINYAYSALTLGGGFGHLDGPIEQALFSSPHGIAIDPSGNLYVADIYSDVIRKITPSGTVSTLAGMFRVAGYTDGAGSAASFDYVTSMTTDPTGNIYAVEYSGHVIRKITPAGVVSTLAGTATQNGDIDATGAAARFYRPRGITYNTDGHLYVTDSNNNKIRKVHPSTGVVTTLATLTASPTGITSSPDGYLYAIVGNKTIARIDRSTGSVTTVVGSTASSQIIDGLGTAASFQLMAEIHADSTGALYVIDGSASHVLRKITPDFNVITVAAVRDSEPSRDGLALDARIYNVRGMCASPDGTLHTAESHTIRRFVPTDLGRAPVIVSSPSSIVASEGSDVQLAFEIDASPTPTFVWKQDAVIVSGQITSTLSLSPSQSTDTDNYTLEATNIHGSVVSDPVSVQIFGTPSNDDFANRTAIASLPSTIEAHNYLTSSEANEPIHVEPGGGYSAWWTWTAPNDGVVTLNARRSVVDALVAVYTGTSLNNLTLIASGASDGSGNRPFLTFNVTAGTSYQIALDGRAGDTGSIGYELFYRYGVDPFVSSLGGTGLVIDPDGNIYTAVSSSHIIRKISPTGVVTDIAGIAGTNGSADGPGASATFNWPADLARASDGTLYVSDGSNHTIRKVAPNGTVSTLCGSVGATGAVDGVGSAARFSSPRGLALSADESQLIVIDRNNYVLRKVDVATGSVSLLAGSFGARGTNQGQGTSARFMSPVDVELAANGNFYVTDSGSYNPSIYSGVIYFSGLREVSLSGSVSALAGGKQGSVDGQGSSAKFNIGLRGLAVADDGNAYVVDDGRVRRVEPDGTVTTMSDYLGNFDDLVLLPDLTGYVSVLFGDVLRLDFVDETAPASLPSITNHPISVDRFIGQDAHFSVTASGLATEFTYQWLLDGSPVVGATAAALSILGIDAGDVGDYTVAVTNSAGTTTSNAATLTVNPAPANDQFTNASALSSLSDAATVDNTGARKEAGEPNHAQNTGGTSLWWTWTAPASGTVIIDSAGSTIDPLIAVYTGSSVNALTEVASARKAGPSVTELTPPPAHLSFTAIEGTLYRIAMDGEAGFSGTLRLRLNYTYNFTTMAGQAGVLGGSDGNGNAASFGQPHETVMDASGNVFVADSWNHVIRKITPSGDVSTFAGATGATGSSDGTGANARFNYPTGLAISSVGDLYVADYGNHTIRKITPAGAVTTFAGSAGVSGTSNGTGAAARFTTPKHLAIDSSDNLYVTDYGKYWVRMISPAAVVSTLAGHASTSGSTDATGTSALFSLPGAMACDGTDNLYVCDRNTLRKIAPGGIVSTVAGVAGENSYVDGHAAIVRIKSANSVAVRDDGKILLADSDAIRLLDTDGSLLTIAGSTTAANSTTDGSGRATRFDDLNQIMLAANGELFATEISGHVIRRGILSSMPSIPVISPEPEDLRVIAGSTVALTSGAIANPLPTYQWQKGGVDIPTATSASLTLLNAQPSDSGQYHLIATNSEGSASSAVAQVEILPLPTNDDFISASILSGNQANASSYNYSATAEGSEPDHGGNAAGNSVWFTWTAPGSGHVTIDTLGSDFDTKLAAYEGNSITALALLSQDSSKAQKPFSRVRFEVDAGDAIQIAVDGVAGASGEIELEIAYSWSFNLHAGGFADRGSADGPGQDARFDMPTAMAADSTGSLYVADRENHIIRKISPTGSVSTLAGSAGISGTADGLGSAARFYSPYGITVDDSGNVYVADSGNSAIRKISPAGVVTTLAGLPGTSGSADGTGTAARFGLPVGIALAPSGELYVTDYTNNLIRKVTLAGVVTTFAGELNAFGGVSRFNSPWGIAVDSEGNIYVSDRSNIRKITSSGSPSLFAGTLNGEVDDTDGIGSEARFNSPAEITFDDSGRLIVADMGNHSIRSITSTGIVRTIGGDSSRFGYLDGVGHIASFASPTGITATPNGEIYIADSYNQLIRRGAQQIAQPQTITFAAIADQLYTETPLALFANADSGLTVSFSLVSGPATLNANELSFTGTGTVTVQAIQAGNENYLAAPTVEQSFDVYGYDGWRQDVFTPSQLTAPQISGENADFDSDGINTLLEYAFGLNPIQADQQSLQHFQMAATELTTTYTRPASRPDLTYTVKASSDLATWSTTGVVHELITTDNGVETWRATFTLSGQSAQFLQIVVDR